MANVSYKNLLEVTQEDKVKVQHHLNINDPIKIEENFYAIEEWVKKQDHLIEAYQYMNRNVVERIYILADGSTELTKIKLEKLFTTRGIIRDLVLNRSYEEFNDCWEHHHFVPLPKLNPADQSRCTVGKMIRENYDEVSMLTLLRYCGLIGEFRLFYDYMHGDRFIFDLQNLSVNFLTKLNPFLLKKVEILLTETYDIKLKGMYFINSPPFVNKILSLIKPFFKEKLFSRLHVINSYEDLHKVIPKEILPEDYGGDAPSLSKLSDQWKSFLSTEESRKLIDNLNKLTSDESKRSCIKFNEEYLGMPGSFRQMKVD